MLLAILLLPRPLPNLRRPPHLWVEGGGAEMALGVLGSASCPENDPRGVRRDPRFCGKTISSYPCHLDPPPKKAGFGPLGDGGREGVPEGVLGVPRGPKWGFSGEGGSKKGKFQKTPLPFSREISPIYTLIRPPKNDTFWGFLAILGVFSTPGVLLAKIGGFGTPRGIPWG